ncbi:holin family protein [Paracoccus ravus]|uniref:holin family protein n=1 Tax=Paracoccus ravus TaxID=2447760 RepID=UPI00106E7E61|nr:holin family protein [Paracoccus ravus]
MGMIDRFLNASGAVTTVSNAATGMAEVFRENATRRMELDEEAHARALSQMGAEFALAPQGWFDGLMNGMNRLPRPLLTLGTLALFVYAMVEPVGFGLRMQNLNLVPEPLWWLLGAIISFYFGAREAHYFRIRPRTVPPATETETETETATAGAAALRATPSPVQDEFADNAALRDWVASRASI